MSNSGIVVSNRQAGRDYFVSETIEAGIELRGSEIKSVRLGQANLKDSFARIEKGEAFLYNLHISPYEFARRDEINPKRVRKLLLRKSEIKYLFGKVSEKGLTLIPLKIYLKGGLAKVELALAKGKKHYDKRQAIKAKAARREIERTWKSRKQRKA